MDEFFVTSEYAYLIPLVSGVATMLIGIIVFRHGRRSLEAKILALLVIVLSLWLFGSAFMFTHCSSPSTALLIDRIIYIFVAAMPAVAYHLATVFTQGRKSKVMVYVGYGIMLLFWIVLWSTAFIDGIYLYPNGCHSQARWLHNVFLVYFIGYSILTLIHVGLAIKSKPVDKKKTQLEFVFLSLLAQSVVGTSAFLPAYHLNTISFSYFSGLITTTILVYAMFRHDLLELRTVAVKIFTVITITASGSQVLLAEESTLRLVNSIIFVLICALGIMVTRNVKEEVESREKGERLARYLANANARLRELDKQKTEFVSIASHQLRSPIAAIKGYASLIFDGSFGVVPEKLKEPLGRILESGQRIAVMVDDFLNVTRIEQGRMTYNMLPQNICSLLNSVVAELQVVASDKGLVLSVICNENENLQVKADEGKLKQIFSNLIDNAIKYTPTGSITISAEAQVPENKVLVKIKDTGIGIAPEEVSNLFQKFNRGSNANETNVLGTGLGLYIARQILKAHDGWVDVQSDGIGKGSTFIVELPAYNDLKSENK